MSSEKLDLLVDMTKEIHKDLKGLHEEVHKIQTEQAIQGKDIAENKDDLIVHMSRTDTLEELVELRKKEVDARLEALEEPKKLKKLLLNWIVKAGSLGGAMYGILKLIEYFKL